MKFTYCDIDADEKYVSVSFNGRNVRIKKDLIKETATFKKRSKVKINRWVLFITLLVLLIIWINISGYFGYLKHTWPKDEYEIWNTTDSIVMVTLMLLTFTSFFFDLLGNVKVVRFLFAIPFNRTHYKLIIVLTNGMEYTIPIKNKSEGARIVKSFALKY